MCAFSGKYGVSYVLCNTVFLLQYMLARFKSVVRPSVSMYRYYREMSNCVPTKPDEAGLYKSPAAEGGWGDEQEAPGESNHDDMAGPAAAASGRDSAPGKTKKTPKSAVIIMPPEDLWLQIQDIRCQHDKAFKRWMPHINMLYPFLPDRDDGSIFEGAAKTLATVCQEIEPFRVVFTKESFGSFRHKKNCTMWLKPLDPEVLKNHRSVKQQHDTDTSEDNDLEAGANSTVTDKLHLPSHESVMTLQKLLEDTFPEFTDLSTISEEGFNPHLSLGQFRRKDIDATIASFQEPWSEIEFEVKEIYMISRENFHDPFHIRHRVKLGRS